jgi:hypothetical protein
MINYVFHGGMGGADFLQTVAQFGQAWRECGRDRVTIGKKA